MVQTEASLSFFQNWADRLLRTRRDRPHDSMGPRPPDTTPRGLAPQATFGRRCSRFDTLTRYLPEV